MHTDEFQQTILDNLHDAIYIVDQERKITFWNRAAERLTGYQRQEVLGTFCWHNILEHLSELGESICRGHCPLALTLTDGAIRESEMFLHHRQGHRLPVSVRVLPLRNSQGTIIGAIEIFRDTTPLSETLQRVQELQEMAFIDPLTGLSNRRFLEMNVRSSLERMTRYGWNFGLLLFDIDHFKRINDTFGHNVGDEALRIISKTLLGNSRPFDIMGRWGGEEFVAIIASVTLERLRATANRYRILVQESTLPMTEENIRLTISVGGTLARQDDTAESLLERSDRLMYQSKCEGRNRVTIEE
ncbi:MAG TPA: diguanylate cyclase [Geobacterales bacterium]|nr:diguanylate cyclase [Geobacterales bacterium]